ncbi:unnamed protein product [Adineta ricciae]|uniref:Uncharacterized protein n=1 Tax=Adineta ricciae TaxID=249248 RepID=A0A815N9D4_ADIRI|nr:unnamed protein product [Adineta ricciae]
MSSQKRSYVQDETEEIATIDLSSRNPDLEEFRTPFDEIDSYSASTPKTQAELYMMNLSGVIRSKPEWFKKMNEKTIRKKWKQEALQQYDLSEKQIDYVLNELIYYDSIRDGSMEMSTVDGVWQSDQLISNDIKQSLIENVRKLEDIPASDKDWHPGTNQQILDLVHPSLFPYVNHITRIKIKRQKTSSDYTKSDKYQWLPTEFNVSRDGQVKIESYINNLHPIEHKDFYLVIEQIFQCFIPLFNKCLTDLLHEKPNRIDVNFSASSRERKTYKDEKDEEEDDDDENKDDNDDQDTILDLPEFQMPSPQTSTIDLCGRKLQVIVKLANHILTADNPEYSGGVWHVEGMENEHIVATGIFYYHSSNITESNLQFRTAINEPLFDHDASERANHFFHLYGGRSLNQNLGQVITQEDRCLVFPNIYQHRVAPFQLTNPNQLGLRKILVFFLVDPSISILSTANVPPQQSHWLRNIVRSMFPFNQLPQLVIEKIINYIDFPMSLNQAYQYRRDLMEERKYFINQNTEQLFERPFSLCEH